MIAADKIRAKILHLGYGGARSVHVVRLVAPWPNVDTYHWCEVHTVVPNLKKTDLKYVEFLNFF